MATKLMNYWQEGSSSIAIPAASASDVVGLHNKIGGILSECPSYIQPLSIKF
jgi:hypothetical protein